MKNEVVMTLVFLLCIDLAFAEFFFENNAYIDINISSRFNLIPIDPSQQISIDKISAKLSIFPLISSRQQVLDIDTRPLAAIEDDRLIYLWYTKEASHVFWLDSLVYNINSPIEVGNVEISPTEDIYTSCTKIIDCNSTKIILPSKSLLAAETDLFRLAYKVANFVHHHIEYSVYHSGQVLASEIFSIKKGVCSEYAVLYAAMMRSLGIPTKYIYGMLYSEDAKDFVAHNWNEVYFPGYGWVPFDSALAQYGAIDSSHIKLKELIDPGEPAVEFDVDGTNVRLVRDKIDKSATLRNTRPAEQVNIEIDIEILRKNIGPGSYNLLRLVFHNPNNHFYASRIDLALPEKISVSDRLDSVCLGPNETKSIYQLLLLTDDLDDDYIYDFSVEVSDRIANKAAVNFSGSVDYNVFSEEQLYFLLSDQQEQYRRGYSENISMNCSHEKKTHYEFDQMAVTCTISNNGKINMDGVGFCSDFGCEEFSLGAGRSVSINKTIYFIGLGPQEQKVYLDHPKAYRSFYVYLDVIEAPKINITSLRYPRIVDYSDTFNIEFRLERFSSDPSNLVIDFNKGDKVWRFFDFPDSKTFTFDYSGSKLDAGLNELVLDISYTDENGVDYHRKEKLTIELNNVPFWKKLFPESYNFLIIIFVSIFVFIAILLIIFRPSRSAQNDFKEYASARFELAEDDIDQIKEEIKDLRDEKKEIEGRLVRIDEHIQKIYKFIKRK